MSVVVHIHTEDGQEWIEHLHPRSGSGQFAISSGSHRADMGQGVGHIRSALPPELTGMPEPGKPFLLYRLGRGGHEDLTERDAGNAYGVAEHLTHLDNFESVHEFGGSGDHVNLYWVITKQPVGKYEPLVSGRGGTFQPGVGYREHGAGGGPRAISLSFGKGGYEAKLLSSIPLENFRERLKSVHACDNFDEAGWRIGGDVIRAVAEHHLSRHYGHHHHQPFETKDATVQLTYDLEAHVFVEAEHPRKGRGPGGGEFAAKGTGGSTGAGAAPSEGTFHVHVHPPGAKTTEPAGPGPAAPHPRPALKGSQGHPATISSRFVTAKRSAENSNETYTQTGLAAMKLAPESFKTAMELLKNPKMYPYFRDLHGTPDEIAEQALSQMVKNIKYVYQHAPPLTREFGNEWYREENKRAREVATKYTLPLASTAGGYAALSPQRDWNMNVVLSEAVIHAVAKEQHSPWTDAMTTTGRRIAHTAATRALLRQIRGKTLAELPNPYQKAFWIRTWEQSRPPEERHYRLFRPDGKLGDWARKKNGQKATLTWGSVKQIANAVQSVESGGDREILSDAMGAANKVRSFYNNILDPNSPNGDITADTHAIGVAFLDALGGSTAPVMHGLGTSPEKAKHPAGWQAAPRSATTGVAGLYGLHAEAVRRAARDLGVLPDEVQSLTWEAKRALFDHMPKGAKAAIHRTWEAYQRGKIGFEQAQDQVVSLAGGWKEPDWVREPRDD